MRSGSDRFLGTNTFELTKRSNTMMQRSDSFILAAVAISFVLSGYLWFTGQRDEGVFTAMWVPSILCFGIYFKMMGLRRTK
jgi:hypothetical protein